MKVIKEPEEELTVESLADYDTIYNEVKLDSTVDKMIEYLRNEPPEETEEERINREADEFFNKKYQKAYDCYCGQIKTRYGYLDETNLPIDDEAINYASCKCNFDADVLKEMLIQGMKDLNEEFINEGDWSEQDLAEQYGEKLVQYIEDEFEANRVYVDWQINDVKVSKNDNLSLITIMMTAFSDDFAEYGEEVEEVIKRFITDIITDFMGKTPYMLANKSIFVKRLDVHKGHTDSMIITIELKEKHNVKAFNGDTIDDVAKNIGGFEAASQYTIGCFRNSYRDVENGEPRYKTGITAQVCYIRDKLSYAGGFKFWDRFTKIRVKGSSKLTQGDNTAFLLAAEYNPNPDVVLVWVDSFKHKTLYGAENKALLMHRADFDNMINELKNVIDI